MEQAKLKELITQARQHRRRLAELRNRTALVEEQLETVNQALRAAIDVSEAAYAKLSEEDFQMMLSELNDPENITVEVVYATRTHQAIKEIQVCRGATVEDCVLVSKVLKEFPEIDLAVSKVGIHGTIKRLGDEVREGDRIEIYRPVEVTA